MKMKRRDLKNIIPSSNKLEDWSYKDQDKWLNTYPKCGGRAQSPVDLPYKGLIKARGARRLTFKNYDVKPVQLTVENDGRTLSIRGKWKADVQPLISGGAAHGRRYIFHSMTLHWPSEHSVGGFQYPMESQVLHISAEYDTMEQAVNASARDPLAFLIVANIYRFDSRTQEGLSDLLDAAGSIKNTCQRIPAKPLEYYSPPLKQYACYQGSLTTPPCTEAVLWLVRAKAMTVTRSRVEQAEKLLDEQSPMPFRGVQPMNDRKTYLFKN
ncbi:unnamed protein product [Chilo suppressalis]|uniref:Alpha-carbonic anhydrase domain-containing protein n=1 Tax=Chilo suppressalis TaxID=168631 RepID=A0ABN8BEC3_CHISP|nr:unnamed protein product [Chilo suppressalis]